MFFVAPMKLLQCSAKQEKKGAKNNNAYNGNDNTSDDSSWKSAALLACRRP
jgi:major membrane immunogen (membrane-anchored lipoprotein)